MDISLYSVQNDTVVKSNFNSEPKNWSSAEWIDIRFDKRETVTRYFQDHKIYLETIDCIGSPEQFPFANTFGDLTVLSLSISNSNDIYKTEYVTVILGKTFFITIIPMDSKLLDERSIDSYKKLKYPHLRNFLFYQLSFKTLANSNVNMSVARHRLQALEYRLANDPDQLIPKEIMLCERDINQLSDIIEDQYVGFEILVSLRSSSYGQEEVQQASKVIKGFEPLNKAMLRLEKKAESLRIQYALIQQEKSTRKINLLTIIQAVFVPLTFIAGVYGMNFINIPELNWTFGYGLVWLVFVGLASGLMVYFYRKGWFD